MQTPRDDADMSVSRASLSVILLCTGYAMVGTRSSEATPIWQYPYPSKPKHR